MSYEELIELTNKSNPFNQFLGIKITELSETHAVAKMTMRDEHKNPHGMLHGGVLYTIADSAAGILSRAEGKKNVTLEGKLNFIKSITSGTIKAVATTIHQGGRTGVYSVNVYDDKESILAAGVFTMYFIG